jgi:hypothetical protein
MGHGNCPLDAPGLLKPDTDRASTTPYRLSRGRGLGDNSRPISLSSLCDQHMSSGLNVRGGVSAAAPLFSL